jgi:hypothetical protein
MNIGNLYDDFFSLTVPASRPVVQEQDAFSAMLNVRQAPLAEADVTVVTPPLVSTLDWLRIIETVAGNGAEPQGAPKVAPCRTQQPEDQANSFTFYDFSKVATHVGMPSAFGKAVEGLTKAVTISSRPVLPATGQSPDAAQSGVLNLDEGQLLLWSTIATGYSSFQWLSAIHQPSGQDRNHGSSVQSLLANTKTVQVQPRSHVDIVARAADADSEGWFEQPQELADDRLDLADSVNETSSSLVFLQSEFQKEFIAFGRSATSAATIFYRNYFSPMPDHELIQQWMNLSLNEQGVIYLNGRQYRNGAN